MTLEQACFLLTPAATAAADRHREATDLLRLSETLRRHFSSEEASAVSTLVRLRQQAAGRFPWAEDMYFTGEALQQSTSWPLAVHRARRLDGLAPAGPVLDLGCGLGGDALALAAQRQVVAYDRDPVRLLFARENARVAGLAERITFVEADWLATDLPAAGAAFADPSRRQDGRRRLKLSQMDPPIEHLLALQRSIPALAVKVAPGLEQPPPDCSLEFVSSGRVCKEAVLWFGPLAAEPRWASHFDGDAWHRLASSGQPAPVGPLEPGWILHEPDPAAIRAGALLELCRSLGAHLLDASIAYMVSPRAVFSPWVQSFRILEVHPFGLRRLKARLRELGIARLEIKKRGFPEDPEKFRRNLRLARTGEAAVLILTRRGQEHLMLLGRRLPDQSCS